MSVTEIENYRELILENIEYDCLKQRYPLYLDDLNLLDIFLSGSMEERASVVVQHGKEVRKIEQRVSEFTASHPAGRHERSRSLSAGAER